MNTPISTFLAFLVLAAPGTAQENELEISEGIGGFTGDLDTLDRPTTTGMVRIRGPSGSFP
jgi:hypothetical protein